MHFHSAGKRFSLRRQPAGLIGVSPAAIRSLRELCDVGQGIAMRILWKSSPSPRLLNTVVPNVAPAKADPPTGRFSLKRSSLFSGNGTAIFVGVVVGAAILSILGITYTRHQERKRQKEAAGGAMTATTSSTSSLAESARPPAPIPASQIHVSAISLGEPHLAIVNGKQVSEGESISISLPSQSAPLRLQVVKIADGRIDLSDGTQVITVRLETLRAPNRKP